MDVPEDVLESPTLTPRNLDFKPMTSPSTASTSPSHQNTTPLSYKIKKKFNKCGSSDSLEKSFNTVSESISAMTTQILTNKNTNDRDEALAKMILAELKHTTEPIKTELRKKLMNVVMKYMSD